MGLMTHWLTPKPKLTSSSIPSLYPTSIVLSQSSLWTKSSLPPKKETGGRQWSHEPLRQVHQPWIEVNQEDDTRWQPSVADSYTGSPGGGKPGPTQKMIVIARKSTQLSDIFLAIIPLSFSPMLPSRQTSIVTKIGLWRRWLV